MTSDNAPSSPPRSLDPGFVWPPIACILLAGVGLSWNPTAPAQVMAAVFILCALAHAVVSYGARDAIVFFLICNAVAFAMENLAGVSGFPFGSYHFEVGADLPHVGSIPVIVGPLWFGGGYFSWIVASTLLDDADRRLAEPLNLIALPLVAACVLTQWDLVMDAPNATIAKAWIWHQGGAMFGVPMSNYLGWLLTSWLFYLGFAFYLSRSRARAARTSVRLDLIALLFYFSSGLTYVVPWLMNQTGETTDGAGQVWKVHDIREATVVIFLLTMSFTSLLTGLRLATRRTRQS